MVRARLLTVLLVLLTSATPAIGQRDAGSPPGRLVDVGGRRLPLYCSGSAAPTVVIEAGASAFAIDFTLVQPEVAKAARVCSYDRAGSGWSDARMDVDTPMRVVRDLRTLLDAAGEKGPFIRVGASRGGLYVRLFQAEHPADVAGWRLALSPRSDVHPATTRAGFVNAATRRELVHQHFEKRPIPRTRARACHAAADTRDPAQERDVHVGHPCASAGAGFK